jgi:hypothetical protein
MGYILNAQIEPRVLDSALVDKCMAIMPKPNFPDLGYLEKSGCVYIPLIDEPISAILDQLYDLWEPEIERGLLFIEENSLGNDGDERRFESAYTISASATEWRHLQIEARGLIFINDREWIYVDFAETTGIACSRKHADRMYPTGLSALFDQQESVAREMTSATEQRYYLEVLAHAKSLI